MAFVVSEIFAFCSQHSISCQNPNSRSIHENGTVISYLIWIFYKCFHWNYWIQWPKYLSLKGFEPVASSARDHDATTEPARHMWKIGSLNWAQFMIQWFNKFPEFAELTKFLFYLGKASFTRLWWLLTRPFFSFGLFTWTACL